MFMPVTKWCDMYTTYLVMSHGCYMAELVYLKDSLAVA